MSNYLDRLAADRAANVHTGPAQASAPRAPNIAPGGPREAGRHAAANELTWHHVAALCALLPEARNHAVPRSAVWGADRLRLIAGDSVADTHTFDTFADWTAWLEGVNDLAAAIEIGA